MDTVKQFSIGSALSPARNYSNNDLFALIQDIYIYIYIYIYILRLSYNQASLGFLKKRLHRFPFFLNFFVDIFLYLCMLPAMLQLEITSLDVVLFCFTK
jgi:hypothetical protein